MAWTLNIQSYRDLSADGENIEYTIVMDSYGNILLRKWFGELPIRPGELIILLVRLAVCR